MVLLFIFMTECIVMEKRGLLVKFAFFGRKFYFNKITCFFVFCLGGTYHGKLVFPREFPFKPPSIYMITPNGRFKCNTRYVKILPYLPCSVKTELSASTKSISQGQPAQSAQADLCRKCYQSIFCMSDQNK